MSSRRDYGIVRASLLSDPRTLEAAEELVRRGLASEPTSVPTVAGLVSSLAIWALREGDDGVLPGSGLGAARLALGCSAEVAAAVVEILSTAGLLRAAPAGLRLAGWLDCYGGLVRKRSADRLKAATRRSDVAATSHRHPGDVAPTGDGSEPVAPTSERHRGGVEAQAGSGIRDPLLPSAHDRSPPPPSPAPPRRRERIIGSCGPHGRPTPCSVCELKLAKPAPIGDHIEHVKAALRGIGARP